MSELLESLRQDTKSALEGHKAQRNRNGGYSENTRKYLSGDCNSRRNINVMFKSNRVIHSSRRVMPNSYSKRASWCNHHDRSRGSNPTLRVRYSDTVGSGASGAVAGEEALSPFKIAEAYQVQQAEQQKQLALKVQQVTD